MAKPALYSPKDAAQRLDIASSTLRLWASRFATYLSNSANPIPGPSGRVGKRTYNTQDIETLARVKSLLTGGLTFDATSTALLTSDVSETLPAVLDPGHLAESGDVGRALVAITDLAISQRQRLDDVEARLEALEQERRPLWRRLWPK
jgi:DNA-binding transcriptional MerR regulator